MDFFKPKKTTVVEGSKVDTPYHFRLARFLIATKNPQSSKCKWFEKEEKQKIDGKTYYKSAEVGEEVYNRQVIFGPSTVQ